VASITVPVQAVVAGAAGNVAAGAISSITSPIQGIDTVTNPRRLRQRRGLQEQDSALKKRFAAYILGLSRGDYYRPDGVDRGRGGQRPVHADRGLQLRRLLPPGFFFVVADDGSGSPSVDFMAAITAAAQAVRPLGVQCTVFPPVCSSPTSRCS
jgi:hypothetical protein